MARKKQQIDTAGIDKLELFLQTYFKQVILAIGAVVAAFILGYSGYLTYQSSKQSKADMVGEDEMKIVNATSLEEFESLAYSVSFLKDYILLRSAEAWVMLDNKEKALEAASNLSADYSEMGDSISYDLGKDINIAPFIESGYMKPLWYYRLVLNSKPEDRAANLELFRSKYPESELLKLLENWSTL